MEAMSTHTLVAGLRYLKAESCEQAVQARWSSEQVWQLAVWQVSTVFRRRLGPFPVGMFEVL
jgi:hypothetical protein